MDPVTRSRQVVPAAESPLPDPEPASQSLSPRRLGRYELCFRIAEGGMGAVYAARMLGPHGFDRLVAVKLLRSDGDRSARQALLREAKLAARISHRNVLSTLDLDEHEGTPLLVMELIQGVTLRELLSRLRERRELLEPALVAWIGIQSALGLHAAHEAMDGTLPLGLVHRDVSPHNLLLGFDGRVCVSDFGIAKLMNVDAPTQDGVVKGKFAYMSPEQVRGEPLDRRSDVFSLGVVLYEALEGRKPFRGDNPAAIVNQIIQRRPMAAPSASPRHLAVAHVALRCLEKERDARFQDAAAVADALRAALKQHGQNPDAEDLAQLLESNFSAEKRALAAKLSSVQTAPSLATGTALSFDATAVAPVKPARGRWLPAALLVVSALGVGALLLPPENIAALETLPLPALPQLERAAAEAGPGSGPVSSASARPPAPPVGVKPRAKPRQAPTAPRPAPRSSSKPSLLFKDL